MRLHPVSRPRAARAVGLAAAALLPACTTVVVRPVPLADGHRASPVPAGEVVVMRAPAPDSLPASCARVTGLQASGEQDFSDAGELVARMREAAGEAGGNVVAILSWEEAGRGERVGDALLGTGVDRDVVALALRCPAEVAAEVRRRWPWPPAAPRSDGVGSARRRRRKSWLSKPSRRILPLHACRVPRRFLAIASG